MEIITELNQDFNAGGKNSIKWLENAMLNASIGFNLRLQNGLMLEACEYLETFTKFFAKYKSLNDVFGDTEIKVSGYQSTLDKMQSDINSATNVIRQRINIVPV
jgi:hypothetical protein